jgi:hypothetical protein
MRQQTLSFLKRKMDAFLRQQARRSAVCVNKLSSSAAWADLAKQFTNSSQNGLLICTSVIVFLQVFFRLTVILTVIRFRQ